MRGPPPPSGNWWVLEGVAGSRINHGASSTRITPGSFQIPFFKDCGEDDECVTDLVLSATMDIVGSRYGVSLRCPQG